MVDSSRRKLDPISEYRIFLTRFLVKFISAKKNPPWSRIPRLHYIALGATDCRNTVFYTFNSNDHISINDYRAHKCYYKNTPSNRLIYYIFIITVITLCVDYIILYMYITDTIISYCKIYESTYINCIILFRNMIYVKLIKYDFLDHLD